VEKKLQEEMSCKHRCSRARNNIEQKKGGGETEGKLRSFISALNGREKKEKRARKCAAGVLRFGLVERKGKDSTRIDTRNYRFDSEKRNVSFTRGGAADFSVNDG